MGDREGEESFGFAPRGPQMRRGSVETSQPSTPDHVFARKPHPVRASMAQTYDHERSETPVWLWLGIGVVLGVGATLLSSSLWLPKSSDVDLVELEAGDQVASSPDIASGPGVASANEATQSPPPPEDSLASQLSVAEAAAILAAPVSLEPAPQSSASLAEESPVNAEVAPLSSPDSDKQLQTDAQLAALDAEDAAVRSLVNEVSQNGAAEQAEEPKEELKVETERRLTDQPADPQPRVPEAAERLLPVDDAETDEDGAVEVANAVDVANSDPDLSVGKPETRAASDAAGAGGGANGTELATVTPAVAASPSPPSSTESEEGGRLYRVQLAAVANEAAARVFWREANERLPSVFGDLEPVFDKRVVDERLYLRIWVGSFGLRREADSYCGWLKDQGQDCFVTRVDNL